MGGQGCAGVTSTGVSRLKPGASYTRGDAKNYCGDILVMSRYLDKKHKEFDPDAWISQAAAARLREVSPQAIAELVKRGRFTTWTIGGRKFLKRSEVEAFQANSPGPPPKGKRMKRKG